MKDKCGYSIDSSGRIYPWFEELMQFGEAARRLHVRSEDIETPEGILVERRDPSFWMKQKQHKRV